MSNIPISYAAALLNQVKTRPEQAAYLIDLSTAISLLNIATELTLLRRQLNPMTAIFREAFDDEITPKGSA